MNSNEGEKRRYLSPERSNYERGLYDQFGKKVILTPNKFQILSLKNIIKAEYFTSFNDKPQFLNESVQHLGPNERSKHYIDHVIDPLGERLRQDFYNKDKVGVRGSAVSLDGELPFKDKLLRTNFTNVDTIKDVKRVLKDGSDSGKKTVNITEFDITSQSKLSELTFVTDYLHGYARGFRYSLESFGYSFNSVFPALLVYDIKFLARRGINIEQAKKKGFDPLLKIYVLDYPAAEWVH